MQNIELFFYVFLEKKFFEKGAGGLERNIIGCFLKREVCLREGTFERYGYSGLARRNVVSVYRANDLQSPNAVGGTSARLRDSLPGSTSQRSAGRSLSARRPDAPSRRRRAPQAAARFHHFEFRILNFGLGKAVRAAASVPRLLMSIGIEVVPAAQQPSGRACDVEEQPSARGRLRAAGPDGPGRLQAACPDGPNFLQRPRRQSVSWQRRPIVRRRTYVSRRLCPELEIGSSEPQQTI